MRIGKRTVVLMCVAALALALAVRTLGPVVVVVYVSALAGMALMIGMMAYLGFVALRNWQLEKLPRLHGPRGQDHKPDEITRRAA